LASSSPPVNRATSGRRQVAIAVPVRREVDLAEHGAGVSAEQLGTLLAGHVGVEIAVAAA
jgi:hypothetical protein